MLIFGYAATYFDGSPNARKVAALLVAFAGAMTGLVIADNILLLFVFWELTSITSFLLIGTDDRLAPARAAAQQALLTTGAEAWPCSPVSSCRPAGRRVEPLPARRPPTRRPGGHRRRSSSCCWAR